MKPTDNAQIIVDNQIAWNKAHGDSDPVVNCIPIKHWVEQMQIQPETTCEERRQWWIKWAKREPEYASDTARNFFLANCKDLYPEFRKTIIDILLPEDKAYLICEGHKNLFTKSELEAMTDKIQGHCFSHEHYSRIKDL